MTGYFRRLASRSGLLGEPRSSAAPAIAPLERETVTEVTVPAAAPPVHPAPARATRPVPGAAAAPPSQLPPRKPMPLSDRRIADTAAPEIESSVAAAPTPSTIGTPPAVPPADKPNVGAAAAADAPMGETSSMEPAASHRLPAATTSSTHTPVGIGAEASEAPAPQMPASHAAAGPCAANARATSVKEPADTPPAATRDREPTRAPQDVEPFPAPREPAAVPALTPVAAAPQSSVPTRVPPSPRPAVAPPAPTVRIGTVHVEVRAPQPVAPSSQPVRSPRSAPQAPALRRYYLREW